MHKPIYLFFGFASEYVLNPLYQKAVAEGFDCIELDLFTEKNPQRILKELKNKQIVFINSAHLFFDKKNFFASYHYNGEVISPLEIIDYLKPIRKICFAHDLSQLFHEKEIPWLSLFDDVIIPLERPDYLAFHPHVTNLGWIKRQTHPSPINESNKNQVGFAFCEFEYHRLLGLIPSYDIWEKIVNKKITVKFPHWYGSDEFERYFAEKNTALFPSTSSISDFIDAHEIILTYGPSSVNAEAAYAGRRVINILNDESEHAKQRNLLGHLPNIEFMTRDQCEVFLQNIDTHISSSLAPLTNGIRPFNFAQALDILSGQSHSRLKHNEKELFA
jgi:hypothetical protein